MKVAGAERRHREESTDDGPILGVLEEERVLLVALAAIALPSRASTWPPAAAAFGALVTTAPGILAAIPRWRLASVGIPTSPLGAAVLGITGFQ